MSRFKSLLLRAGILGSLLGFAHGTAFANPEVGTSATLRRSRAADRAGDRQFELPERAAARQPRQ